MKTYSKEFKAFRILLSKNIGYNAFPSSISSMRELLVYYKKAFGLLNYIAVAGHPPIQTLAKMKTNALRHMA